MNQKILIVDDNEDILNLAEIILHDRFETLTASNGDDALKLFDKHKIDLVLLDIMMPGKSGFEVSKILKGKRECPIIFFSAKNTREDILKGLKHGVDYITKPFEPEELLYRVQAQISLPIKRG